MIEIHSEISKRIEQSVTNGIGYSHKFPETLTHDRLDAQLYLGMLDLKALKLNLDDAKLLSMAYVRRNMVSDWLNVDLTVGGFSRRKGFYDAKKFIDESATAMSKFELNLAPILKQKYQDGFNMGVDHQNQRIVTTFNEKFPQVRIDYRPSTLGEKTPSK